MWSGRRLTKNQATASPEDVGPKVWTKIGKAAQKREMQEWTNEKPKLDNARRLRGISFIDPEVWEFQETIKNARRKLEVPMDAALPCRKEQRSTPSFRKLKRRVMNPTRFQKQSMHVSWRLMSPRDNVWNHLYRKNIKITSQTGYNSMSHSNWVHNLIPMPQAMKNSGCKSRSGQGKWKKLETILEWNLEKVKSKKELILEAQRDKKKVHFPALMGVFHLKNAEFEPNFQKFKDECSEVTCSIYWTGLVCVSTDCCKSDGCRCKTTWQWWTSCRRRISIHSGKIGGVLPDCSKFPKSECPDVWIRLPRHIWPTSRENWRSRGTSWTKLVRSSIRRIAMGETIRRSSIRTWMGEKFRTGHVCSSIGNKGYSCQYTWMPSKWPEEIRIWLPCGRNWWKSWSWRTNFNSW